MNSENIKNNDPIQLKQMIIFLKAELTKYEHKVKEYKDSYHYSIIENLEQENVQLTKENDELRKQLHEMQRRRYSPAVDFVWKTKTDWLPVNKQLNEVMKKLKDDADTNQTRHRRQERQITSLHKKFKAHKSSLEQFEYRLIDLIQNMTNQVHNQLANVSITNEERHRFEDGRRRLLKKIEEKNNRIEELQHEMIEVKKQKALSEDNMITATLKSESTKTSDRLLQLEYQLKEVVAKSLDAEKKWAAKLDIFDDMKQRYLKEIEEKNNKIEELQHEMIEVKKQKALSEDNMITATLKSESTKTSDRLLQLEYQLKEVVAKSLDAEKKRAAKLDIFDDMKQRYLKEIEEKNSKIKELQHEMIEVKKQKALSEDNIITATLKSESAKTSETLQQLKRQLKDVLAKSLDTEKKWAAKLDIFGDMKQRYLKEIEEKNSKIEELQLEIKNLKKQKKIAEDNLSQAVSESDFSTSETLILLERQMKEVLAKSLDYEVRLDAKLDVINDLELKLDQLSGEIDDIQDLGTTDKNI